MRGGGFSLMELVVVMTVTVIMSGVAVVALSSTTGNRASIAAKRLLRDMTFARQRAIATGTGTWVVFTVGAGPDTWSILSEDPGSPGRAGATALTDPATGADMVETVGTGTFIGVDIVSAVIDAGSEVGFDWLGQPLNSADTTMAAAGTITLSDGHQITVTISTGHIAYVAP